MTDCEDFGSAARERRLEPQGNTNKNTVISTLPNEVLVEIFATLKDTQPLRSWHQITHVCQHWRYVALEAATLWASPPTVRHNYTVVMLKRSRDSLLDILLRKRTPTDTSTVVLREIGRIESLFIYQRKAGLDHMQSTLLDLGQESSRLRVLEIIHTYPRDDGVFKLSAKTFLHPTSLKQIHLAAIDFDWEIFPIRSLVELSLEGIRASHPPSWTQFQNALRAMPLLEQLYFNLDDLHLNVPQENCPGPLQMPLLRRLAIKSALALIIEGFISHTKFPLLQYAYFKCTSRNNDDDYSGIISTSLSLVRKGDFGCLDCLVLAKGHFMLTKVDASNYNYNQDSEFVPSLWTTAQASTRLAQDTVAAILGLPDIASRLSHLVLTMPLLESGQLSCHIAGLRILTLTAYACVPLIDSLRIPLVTLPDVPIAFPALQILVLLPAESGGEDVDEPALIEHLYDCLLSRQAYGSGVSTLRLMWDLIYKDVRRLREIVDLVQCRAYRTDPTDADEKEEVIGSDSPPLFE